MEFPAHIVFSCLLVCQPAIFVDSKRDGTGAAHGRKGFRMKRAELDRRIANGETLDDIVPALMDDGADITSYDDLKRFAIEKIESDELYLAEHVLKACLDVADYYGYDYSMGTLEKPTARVTKWQFDTQGYRQRWHGRRLSLGVPRRKKEVSTDDHHQADGRAE